MTNNSIPRRPRAKQLNLVSTEDQALQIVLPIVTFTAYCLSIDRLGDLPEMKTMLDSIIPAKRALAMMMASKLGKVINPGDLNSISLEAISYGGYFKLSVTHGNSIKAQEYNVTITDNNKNPLINKIFNVVASANPNSNTEQVSKHTAELMKNL